MTVPESYADLLEMMTYDATPEDMADCLRYVLALLTLVESQESCGSGRRKMANALISDMTGFLRNRTQPIAM